MSTVIEVQHLSKRFIISHEKAESYTALRDVIAQKAKATLQARKSEDMPSKEEFWALNDISFSIEQGQRVGIMGRNGAGKSTLLKVLSRISEPTKGSIKVKGHIASLLEVGTGFHPELTGRENIFLNGAILGMSRKEIRTKFDEIVEFAEIEKFLDTPVKRYSSGMYVRLAFSVAAHLESEILVVDEVLAVGDAQFQKKCMGKMHEVSDKEGRTVLFVSHNMAAIKTLCTSGIILHKGKMLFQGTVESCLEKYLALDSSNQTGGKSFVRAGIPAKKLIYLSSANIIEDDEDPDFRIMLELHVQSSIQSRIGINLKLRDEMGFPVAFGCSNYFDEGLRKVDVGENRYFLKTSALPLAVGKYKLGFELVIPGVEHLDVVEDCMEFEITNEGTAKRKYGVAQKWGFGSIEIKFDEVR